MNEHPESEWRSLEEEQAQPDRGDILVALMAQYVTRPRGVPFRVDMERLVRTARHVHDLLDRDPGEDDPDDDPGGGALDVPPPIGEGGAPADAEPADLRWSDTEIAELAACARARVIASRVRMRRFESEPVSLTPPVAEVAPRAVKLAAAAGCAPWYDLRVAAGVGRELWDEPCERWLALPPGISRGDHIAFTVDGDSMVPLLHSGDVVLVRLTSRPVRGTVVVARQPEHGYVIKQLGEHSRAGIVLTSLNHACPPIRIPADDRLLLGSAVAAWCSHPSAHRRR